MERREHQDNSDVYYQPLPEAVPEEQDVHADHDGYQREHVNHDGRLSSHPSFLRRAAEGSQSGSRTTSVGSKKASPYRRNYPKCRRGTFALMRGRLTSFSFKLPRNYPGSRQSRVPGAACSTKGVECNEINALLHRPVGPAANLAPH